MTIVRLSKVAEKKLSKILEHLYVSSVLTSSEILRELRDEGIVRYRKTKYVKSFFKFIDNMGVSLIPDLLIHKLRLKGIAIITKVKKVRKCNGLANVTTSIPFVRSVVLSIPNIVMISLYVPENMVNIYRNYEGVRGIDVSTYLYEYVIRSKPLPEYLLRAIEGPIEDIVNSKSFESCFSKPLFLPSDWDGKPKIDGLALSVLDALLINPTLTLKELSEILGNKFSKKFALQKTRKAVNRASKFIFGYRVAITKTAYISNLKMGIVIDGVIDPQALCLSIARHPLMIACSWCNNSKKVILYLSLPEGGISEFKNNLLWFLDQLKGYIVDSFEYIFVKGYTSVVNIPYTEWVPSIKSWKYVEDPIPIILNHLRSSECIEI
ncbi:MAG: hypothetical protein QW101_01265 [Ignisphaera sp.]|uniref:Uncharacterized protein n=1 Tax=Ignisphaera aggregans TaxID=334771 RepID=A0A7J3MWD9_9CREN